MRMRKKKNLDVRFAACEPVIAHNPETLRGNWRELFGNANPLHVEIGCGKGRFVRGMAALYPDINFVAIEKEESALIMATERAMTMSQPNVRFLSYDAANLTDIFAPAEVDLLYLNFSDPWPPNRQRKRRLTHSGFLAVYDQILQPDGALFFKTDNQQLFEWSLSEICAYGWLLQNISLDLHACAPAHNVMTEYEARFSSQGSRIFRVEARRRSAASLDESAAT